MLLLANSCEEENNSRYKLNYPAYAINSLVVKANHNK